jgi:hypothetical protein
MAEQHHRTEYLGREEEGGRRSRTLQPPRGAAWEPGVADSHFGDERRQSQRRDATQASEEGWLTLADELRLLGQLLVVLAP